MLNHLCDNSMRFEKVIETKRSRRPNEVKDANGNDPYKLIDPVEQKVTFNFENIDLQTIVQNAIGNLVVTVQNGSIRRSMDSIDKSSAHTGDQWRSVKTDNLIINVAQKRSGNVEIPIGQRIALMSTDELALNMTEEQLRAALAAISSKKSSPK